VAAAAAVLDCFAGRGEAMWPLRGRARLLRGAGGRRRAWAPMVATASEASLLGAPLPAPAQEAQIDAAPASDVRGLVHQQADPVPAVVVRE
jgi:hypothetical protein